MYMNPPLYGENSRELQVISLIEQAKICGVAQDKELFEFCVKKVYGEDKSAQLKEAMLPFADIFKDIMEKNEKNINEDKQNV